MVSRTLRCLWQGRTPLCPTDHVRLGEIVRYGRSPDGGLYFLRICPKCGRRVRCDKDAATLEPRPNGTAPGFEQLVLNLDEPSRPQPAKPRRRVRRGAI